MGRSSASGLSSLPRQWRCGRLTSNIERLLLRLRNGGLWPMTAMLAEAVLAPKLTYTPV